MALFVELRRRNVLKVALLYAVASWLIVWFVGVVEAEVAVPAWTETFTYFVLSVGYPVALWFAWTYEITPGGLKRAADVDQTQSIVYKTGQKLNSAVAVLLVLGILAMFGQRLLPTFVFLVPGVPEGDAPMSSRAPADIRSLTLDNGLKIIVWPDHDIPNVAMYNFVRAGGRNEYPGITGLSHFFEHLMFGATENREHGEFIRTVEAAGGSINAYASEDVTVFMDWFPRSALETIFELEGDRFEKLAILPEALERERNVVFSERRMRVDDNNTGRLREQVLATAYVAHPYQFPVAGWPSDIESWAVEDAARYYDTYYAPNNRTIVIVGDVEPREIFGLAEKYFAPIPAGEPSPGVRTVEPEQSGTRRVVIEAPAQTPLLHIAFHSGGARDPQTQHLSLLSTILTDGASSRLHRALVEDEGIALSVDSYVHDGFDPGLTRFELVLPSGGDLALAERRLLHELQRIIDDGVTEKELTKARNIILADFWRGLATINGKARALGASEIFRGSYEAAFSLPAELQAVTVDDLREAARDVFREKNMTVGVLHAPDEGADT